MLYSPPRYHYPALDEVCTNVDKPENYHALSYVWGTQAPNTRVLVRPDDGSTTPQWLWITPSLEEALLSLSVSMSLGGGDAANHYLYVDQLCINQADNAEKGVQIAMMESIYSRCVRVLVWLGPSTAASDTYCDFVKANLEMSAMKEIVKMDPALFNNLLSPAFRPSPEAEEPDGPAVRLVLQLRRLFASSFPIDGFEDVLDRPWFTRLWIIQEACLGPELVFMCGARSLSYDAFRTGTVFSGFCGKSWLVTLAGKEDWVGVRHHARRMNLMKRWPKLSAIRRTILRGEQKQSLFELVKHYSVLAMEEAIGATDPADRIYGLLGLVSREDVVKAAVIEDLKTKAGMHTAEVAYMNFATRLIPDQVDMLLFCQSSRENNGAVPAARMPLSVPGMFVFSLIRALSSLWTRMEPKDQPLPTWVPDWSANLRVPFGYTDTNTPIFSAGGPLRDQKPRVEDGAVLVTHGVYVDSIERVGTQMLRKDNEGATKTLEFEHVSLFFDEVDEFLRVSIEKRPRSGTTPVYHDHTAIHLLAGGMLRQPDSPSVDALRVMHASIRAFSNWLWRVRRLSRFHMEEWPGLYVEPTTLRGFLLQPLYMLLRGVNLALRVFGAPMRIRGPRLPESAAAVRDELAGPDRKRGDILYRETAPYIECLTKNAGRSLFLTRDGFVGLGPAGSAVGDVVAVLYGGTTAHVLRPGSDDGMHQWAGVYGYIGEAYCEGVMDGELLGKEETEMRERSFRIR